MGKYTRKQFAEDIYDLIKECALSDNDNDDWAKLSRQFSKDARKNIRKYLRNKNLEWSNSQIKIGKYITITVTDNFNNGPVIKN